MVFFAFCLLLAPAVITALVLLIVQRWWACVLLAIALIPPLWMVTTIYVVLNNEDADMGTARIYGPFALSAVVLVGLWIVWYQYDPKSAGEVLAVTEGAAAAYHFKNGRPVLGAVTAAGAVSQWQHSASLPSGHPTPARPSVRTSAKPPRRQQDKAQRAASVRASQAPAQTLKQLVRLHSQGVLSKDEFDTAKARVVAQYQGERPPADAIIISKSGTAHQAGCQHLPDYTFLIPPDFGWISDAMLWEQIGTQQVPATEGNTDLLAVRRCLDCDRLLAYRQGL